ncbi:MAG: putative addiction module antidote protein [Simkaniaceae bacterium]|jgi:probable addiction module antidote protein|nr:MAG: putative addiction module antidote protein [Simkaniaceae bacterium]
MGRRSIRYKEDYLYEELQKPKEAAAYLNECLKDEDPAVFLMALRDVIKANGGMTKLAEEIERNREGLYRSFSNNGNPGINTLVDALDVFGLELNIKPIHYKHAG